MSLDFYIVSWSKRFVGYIKLVWSFVFYWICRVICVCNFCIIFYVYVNFRRVCLIVYSSFVEIWEVNIRNLIKRIRWCYGDGRGVIVVFELFGICLVIREGNGLIYMFGFVL